MTGAPDSRFEGDYWLPGRYGERGTVRSVEMYRVDWKFGIAELARRYGFPARVLVGEANPAAFNSWTEVALCRLVEEELSLRASDNIVQVVAGPVLAIPEPYHGPRWVNSAISTFVRVPGVEVFKSDRRQDNHFRVFSDKCVYQEKRRRQAERDYMFYEDLTAVREALKRYDRIVTDRSIHQVEDIVHDFVYLTTSELHEVDKSLGTRIMDLSGEEILDHAKSAGIVKDYGRTLTDTVVEPSKNPIPAGSVLPYLEYRMTTETFATWGREE